MEVDEVETVDSVGQDRSESLLILTWLVFLVAGIVVALIGLVVVISGAG